MAEITVVFQSCDLWIVRDISKYTKINNIPKSLVLNDIVYVTFCDNVKIYLKFIGSGVCPC